MSRLRNSVIWAEMARRKLQFHKDEDWKGLTQWGLFTWGSVSHLLKSGDLITGMKKENKTIWVWPSEEAYHKHIEPLLSLSLDELTTLATEGPELSLVHSLVSEVVQEEKRAKAKKSRKPAPIKKLTYNDVFIQPAKKTGE